MNRFRVIALLSLLAALGTQAFRPFPVAGEARRVTFNKDVLPVLQKNCQTCHRPGEIAPMSFLTYQSARPWAKAMKAAVLSKQMPPWFADPQYGAFRNAPALTETDIRTLVDWVDGGALEGDAADRPAPVEWRTGWTIEPDVIVSMPQAATVLAQGDGTIQSFLVPNPFKEDTWVTAIEVRPGDRSVVHHVIVQVVDPSREAALRASLGDAALAAVGRTAKNGLGGDPNVGFSSYFGGGPLGTLSQLEELKTGRGAFMTMEAVYAPGTTPMDFRYAGSAKLIKGGGQIRIEVHYTPNGRTTEDKTSIGFTLAKQQPSRSFVLMAPEHMIDPRKPIPAGAANWETSGELTFSQDAELVWFMPHMHLRGKDMTFQLTYPDGRVETVLRAKFNFNWQLGYEVEKPITVPKGSKLTVTAHHDNSANNRANPNPAERVVWGDLTAQEMMIPWFGVVVNRNTPPDAIATYRPSGIAVSGK
jgi:hypothetical protein